MNNDDDAVQIKRALISVYDKTGLPELAKGLATNGIEIVSTGSTAAAIRAAGIPVTPVEQVTSFPEILDGRVKTLHPKIHGGLLADTRNPAHVAALVGHDIAPFQLVVGNLYPFQDGIERGADDAELVELIDIGGPAMLRAAAKNFHNIVVIADPSGYEILLNAIADGGLSLADRRLLAATAFSQIAAYDSVIADWLVSPAGYPWNGTPVELRYGENPHQQAEMIPNGTGSGIGGAEQLHGKPMSFNNYIDADAALRAAYDHQQPAVAIIKHANPCGVAIASDIADAYRLALATDPVSAFGSVVAANRPVTEAMAAEMAKVFTEVVVAPGYEPDALDLLRQKKNLRVMQLQAPPDNRLRDWRQISGGTLVQERDNYQADGDEPANWRQAAGPQVAADTLADLAFAWRAVRAAKSNAILLAKGGAAKGIGMGQVNRVDSAKLAVARADELAGGAAGTVAASDAFFPFADGLQVLLDAGVTAVVQPGGSIRDEEVVAAADAAGVPMFFTGARHFAH